MTILSINVHTSSIFIIFMVLSMVFIFITRRSYYYYYDKYYGVCNDFIHLDIHFNVPVSLFIMQEGLWQWISLGRHLLGES